MAPSGRLLPDAETPLIDDLALERHGVKITTFTSNVELVIAIHAGFSQELAAFQKPYEVRSRSRLVTSRGAGTSRFYVRSDLAPDGYSWFTTIVRERPGADPRLLDVISASLTSDATAEIYAPNGRLVQLVAAGIELARLPPTGPQANSLPDSRQLEPDFSEPTDGAGTAFFVNNTDLVTARHVVDGCARLTFADGTELQLVEQHPTLDLALLSSPRRSRDWIPLHLSGEAKLGQRIIALGYPHYGTLGTALNSTGGNVSALSGLGDDPSKITFSAPIQPGNSGGPLLGLDGSVIGVVIATINKLEVAKVTGTLPENINYAVTGDGLLEFLADQGVSLPRQSATHVDFDAGIPEGMQRAVVPVLCHGK